MDLPETQRAGLTGCVRDSINHIPAAGQGNHPGRTARGGSGPGNAVSEMGWQRMAQLNAPGAGSGAEHASAHHASGLTGSTWVAQPAKVF